MSRRFDHLRDGADLKTSAPILRGEEVIGRATQLVTALELAPRRYGSWIPRGHLLQLAVHNALALSRLNDNETRLKISQERAFNALVAFITQARDQAHFDLLEELADPFHDSSAESIRGQLIEQLSEMHEERLGDHRRMASDALYYFLLSVGHQWAVENEVAPDPDLLSLEDLRTIGLAADLGIFEEMPRPFFDGLSVIDQAIGPDDLDLSDQDWFELILGRIQATFFDDDELLGYLDNTLIRQDSQLVTTAWANTEAGCLRVLMAERWAARRKPGYFPWGEPAVCPIPDPLRPGSVKQLPPLFL
jgi:hypothetical protein